MSKLHGGRKIILNSSFNPIVWGECSEAGSRGRAGWASRLHSCSALNRAINANCRAGTRGIVACVFRTAAFCVKGTCWRCRLPTSACIVISSVKVLMRNVRTVTRTDEYICLTFCPPPFLVTQRGLYVGRGAFQLLWGVNVWVHWSTWCCLFNSISKELVPITELKIDHQ